MDSVTSKPAFRSSGCPLQSFKSEPIFFGPLSSLNFHHLRKPQTPSLTCSCKNPLNPNFGHPSESNNRIFPSNLIRVWFPVLKTIKDFATLRTEKWASSVGAYRETMKGIDEYKWCYFQNGGLEMALLSVSSNAKLRISPFFKTLANNPTFVSGLFAWIVAQSVKVILNFFLERKWDFQLLFASGGMPSSHSALCTALTTSVAICHGIADSLFPVCLGFSLIVMYDAIGVRRHAGMQAEVLNMIVADLFQGHPISERKLKELLGHTPSQVFAGAVLGILVACFCCQGCLVA